MSGGFPIKCFSCNRVIGDKIERYEQLTMVSGYHGQDALDAMKVRRDCCRRMFLSHVSKDELLLYPDPTSMNTEKMGFKARSCTHVVSTRIERL